MKKVDDKYRGSKEFLLVYAALVSAARMRGTITYQEIAVIMGLPLKGSYMGREVGQVLGEISEREHLNGRPMLSAVAVGVSGKPGPGFATLARFLGRLESEQPLDERFWQAEREATFKEWVEDFKTYQPRSKPDHAE